MTPMTQKSLGTIHQKMMIDHDYRIGYETTLKHCTIYDSNSIPFLKAFCCKLRSQRRFYSHGMARAISEMIWKRLNNDRGVTKMEVKIFRISFDDVGIVVQVEAITFDIASIKAEKMLEGCELGNKVSGRVIESANRQVHPIFANVLNGFSRRMA